MRRTLLPEQLLALLLLGAAIATVSCLGIRDGALQQDAGSSECAVCHDYPPETGAHGAHQNGSAYGKSYPCEECHPLRTSATEAGHPDTIVQVAFPEGGMARKNGAEPSYAGTRCDGVYCHGATEPDPGGSNRSPDWNETDIACGWCHSVPPGSPHPASGECGSCHGEAYSGGMPNQKLHINGSVDLGEGASGSGCSACHGFPPDTGAHQAHLNGDTYGKQYQCGDCHPERTSPGQAGHGDDVVQVEFPAGGMARKSGGTPSFDGTRCSGVYCHGATIRYPGGSNKSPEWSETDLSCGSCHGVPPGSPHTGESECGDGDCHGMAYSGGAPSKKLHINGAINAGEGEDD